MIPVYPVGFGKYYSLKADTMPKGLDHAFYLSWEDALWDLLEAHNVPVGSVVFVPEFFCMDVVENMKSHGLKPVWYPMDEHFQTNPEEFLELLLRHKPSVVVIFHAVGITNGLFEKFVQWKHALPIGTLLIEDAVHRVVDSKEIQLLTKQHYVIDSVRKVTPGMGSNLYGKFPNKLPLHTLDTFLYQVQVVWWWLLYQLFTSMGLVYNAEAAMILGYEKIGDSKKGAPGWKIFQLLSNHIDREKIYEIKKKQVLLYEESLKEVLRGETFFKINFTVKDRKQLRGFPVGVKHPYDTKVIEYLRKRKIVLRLELECSPWAQKHGVVYLPLGPHISSCDQNIVVSIVKEAIVKLQI
jgi:hypothetical protein